MKSKKSFSLIEVLIFVSILSVFIITAITATTASLRNMTINQHKLLAVRYSNELDNWLRSQKEVDWNVFIAKSSLSGTTYCFNTSPITAWGVGSGDSSYDCNFNGLSPNFYKREVTLSNSTSATVNISIIVSWNELGIGYSESSNTIFTLLEK